MRGRRQFLRSVGIASVLGSTGVASAAHSERTLFSYDPWTSDNSATVKYDDRGDFHLEVNGSEVRGVDHPLWMDWRDDYLAVSDNGSIKIVDGSGNSPDVEELTSTGKDVLPNISGENLLFGRDLDVYEIPDFVSQIGGWSSPNPRQSARNNIGNNIDLPGGDRGGRNAGSKRTYNRALNGYRIQVKLPRRSSSVNYFGDGPVWAANVELFKENKWQSNTQIFNIHIGYQKKRGNHCLVLFGSPSSSRKRSVCAPNLKRLWRKAKRMVFSAMQKAKSGGRVIAKYGRPAAKIAVKITYLIGVAAYSFMFGN